MDVETPFVVDKGLVALLVRLYPVANFLPQCEVVRGSPVKLIGERAEKAVPVAEGRGGIEPHGTQLLIEQLAVLCRIREV